ncbi:MAG: insulinase family protein, partial [Candidatus Methanomethylophilaceae archaeon]
SGSSSRLFQGVREDKALVYSIYNSIDQNSDASSIGTYMSATEENVLEAIETTGKIYCDLKNNGLQKGELDRARNLVKGATVRYTESTEHRMYALAKNFILTGRPDTIQERLAALDAVTENDIMRVAQDVISANALNIVMYGNKVKEMKDFDVSQIDL